VRTVRAAKNSSNASENADISQTVVVSKSVGFRNTEMFGGACSEDSKSHVVANSVDSHLHIGKSTPELHLGRMEGFLPQNGTGDNHDDNILIHTG
jgi:hypothetical protein